jgi:hypothetical protein
MIRKQREVRIHRDQALHHFADNRFRSIDQFFHSGYLSLIRRMPYSAYSHVQRKKRTPLPARHLPSHPSPSRGRDPTPNDVQIDILFCGICHFRSSPGSQ